ncbi:hypothetical protein HU200_013046 [Digitaria exilis]|uniref:RecF/RecN/SMC N-terminal domain-containing protein n=1 Tax=Digitaria exilis TaxID=1010633 RepID=A0A835KMP8_9POAL|nr:hypothetical protein HU200_013046 [Digitaria exilis]
MHTIGPFFDFTAIIGPNGAGKSNLMDAISFVLGVRSVQLRTRAQLKDLIYALDDRGKEAKGRRAYVRLVYQMGADELHFTRTITDAGGSEYRIAPSTGKTTTPSLDPSASSSRPAISSSFRSPLLFQSLHIP